MKELAKQSHVIALYKSELRMKAPHLVCRFKKFY